LIRQKERAFNEAGATTKHDYHGEFAHTL
jgi:hypothetical protein